MPTLNWAGKDKVINWLCMMYPRLRLLHRLLANDGVIFISIDDNDGVPGGTKIDEFLNMLEKL